MRYLPLALLLLGCYSKPALTKDLEVFCGAPAAKDLPTFGAWLEPKLESAELKAELGKLKSGSESLMEFQAHMEALLATAKIDSCPTMKMLFEPRH